MSTSCRHYGDPLGFCAETLEYAEEGSPLCTKCRKGMAALRASIERLRDGAKAWWAMGSQDLAREMRAKARRKAKRLKALETT